MLETQRLTIRRFAAADLDDIFEMRCDPEVMRYVREPETKKTESAKWMKMISGLWESEGIGYCAVIERSTGNIVGWCGLWRINETGEIEVGYALKKKAWGSGYATEAAEALLGYGFKQLRLERIVAVAYPDNSASLKVMKKLGMGYVGKGIFYGKNLVQYAITRIEYAERANCD